MTKRFGIGLIASCINVSFMTDPQCPWVSGAIPEAPHHLTRGEWAQTRPFSPEREAL